jgi:hypothetical protein
MHAEPASLVAALLLRVVKCFEMYRKGKLAQGVTTVHFYPTARSKPR